MPASIVALALVAWWCDIWGNLGAATSAAVVDDFAKGLDGWQIAYSPDYYKGGFGASGLRVKRDALRGPTMVATVAFHNAAASEVAFITKTLANHPRLLDVAAVRVWLRLDLRRGSGLESFIIRLRTSPRRFIDLRLYPGQQLPVGRWQQVTVPVDLSKARNVWSFVLDTVKWLTLRLDDIDDENTELVLRLGRIEFLLRTPPAAYRPRVVQRPRGGKLRVLLAQHSSAGFYRLRQRLAEALPRADVDERLFRGLHFPLFWSERPREEPLATDLFVFLDTDPLVLRRREAEAIADAVASGAHLIVLGGPNSLNNSATRDSPLVEVLPVQWDRRGALSPNVVPRPAGAAKNHPLSARVPLALTGPVRRANEVTPRQGARVVLEAGGAPFVVTWQYMRGRATVIAGWHSGEDFFTGPASAEWMRTLLRWAAGRLPKRWLALRSAPAETGSGSNFEVIAELHGGDADDIGMTATTKPEFALPAVPKPVPVVRLGAGRFRVAAPVVGTRHLVLCCMRAGDDWLAVPVHVRPAVELDAVTEGGLGKQAYAPGQPAQVLVTLRGADHTAVTRRGRIIAALCPPRWPPRPLVEVARAPAAQQTAVRFRMPPLTPGKWWLWLRLEGGQRPEPQTLSEVYAVRLLDMTDLFPIIAFVGGGGGGHRLDRDMVERRVDDLVAHGFNTAAISGVPRPQQTVRLHAEAYAQARGMAVMYEYTNFSLLGRGKPTRPCVLSPRYREALGERLKPMIEGARRTPRLISVKITDEPIANRNSLDDCQWCRDAFRARYGIELPGRNEPLEPGPTLWAVQDFVGEYVRTAYRASRQVLYEAYGRAASERRPNSPDARRDAGPRARGKRIGGRQVRRPWLEPFDLLLTYMSAGLGFGGRTIEDAVKWSEACDRIDFDVYPYYYPSSQKVRMLLAWPCFAYIREVARHFRMPWGFYVELDDRNWPFQKNPAEASSECAWTALAQGAMYLNTFIYRAFGTGNNARPERWEALGRTLRLVRALGPVLVHTTRPRAALAVFEPSAYRRAMGGYRLPRYLFAALRAAAGGCDVAVEDLCMARRTIDARALVMVGVKILHRDFAPLLVRWVRDGGVLFADTLPSRDERGRPLTLPTGLGIRALPPGKQVVCGRGQVVVLPPDAEKRWESLFEAAPAARLREEIAALRRQLVDRGIAMGPTARGVADAVEVGLRSGEGIAVVVAVNHSSGPITARLDLPAGRWERGWLAEMGAEGELALRPIHFRRRGRRLALEVELPGRSGAAVLLGGKPVGAVAARCRPQRVRPGERFDLVVSRQLRTLEPAELQLRGPGGVGARWLERGVGLRGSRWTLPVTVPLDAPPGRYTLRVRLPMRGDDYAVATTFEVSTGP